MRTTTPEEDAGHPKISDEEMNQFVERLAITLILISERLAQDDIAPQYSGPPEAGPEP